jgi:galactonate dehydratase
MKIESIRPIPVKGRHYPRFPMVFVEVRTDEGVTGLGEALPFQSSGLLQSIQTIGEWIRGRDPFQVERLWEELFRRGADLSALSGIETALWDIVGQVANLPIRSLSDFGYGPGSWRSTADSV